MTRTRSLTLSVVAAVALIGGPAASLWAQTTAAPKAGDHESHHPAAAPSSEAVQQPPAAHDHTADKPRGMMADRAAADATLNALVAKMNAAKGDARIDAIAELLTALVQQHTAMGAMMASPEMKQKMEGMMDKKDAGK